MAKLGYHASHEQFAPSALLEHVQHAEAAGFDAAMCSDHFHPWTSAQGHSGFAWSWLGAALEATSLPFGVVNAPGYRYHPAVIAQAAATLAELYPGRFWLAIGSGENLNEHITGERWPAKPERNARLEHCANVMRALWRGECVSETGPPAVDEARLYTLPEQPPQLVGAALSPETARWMGRWTDALITVNQPRETLRKVVDAFREGGGEHKPLFLQVHVGYAASPAQAEAEALEQWRGLVFASRVLADLRMPADFEALGRRVGARDLEGHVRVSTDPARQTAWLQEDLAMGFDALYLHNTGSDQRRFIDDFGATVLPQLRG